MTAHAYPRGIRGPALKDVMLVLAWFVFLFLVEPSPFRTLMLGAIPLVLATLHFPSRVDVDAEGVSFAGYGRAHRFAWNGVTRVRVRRFLVKDRVLVRIEPSTPWRGRYWVVDSIEEFEGLVRELEGRAAR